MIQIKHKNLDQLARTHCEAIICYIKSKKKEAVNKSIVDCFGDEWDLKKLILAKPIELEKLSTINQNKDCNNLTYFETLYSYLTARKNIKFKNADDEPYNAYQLIKSLGITVCPYCNRNTIYNLKYSTKRTSELDHFYPKSKYPFFAVSFYNLIPSCKVCNRLKSDNADKKYINPYDDRFDFNQNAKFALKIKNADFYNNEKSIKLTCKINPTTSKDERVRMRNNIKDFKLFDLYQNHKDIALELIQKEYIYNESYIDELFRSYEGTLFKNREDVLRLITGGYVRDEELNKRPLSKLVKDISEELDLL